MSTEFPHYVLVVDEKMCNILTAMIGTSVMHPEIFDRYCKKLGITQQEILAFLRNSSDKQHEFGWCNDTGCMYQKKS